ncbi:MAG: peptidoglycan DD-metalloendopeptidase family protein [Candidatus Absconditabacterales bacterium]
MMTTVMLFSTVCQANSIASSYTPEQTNVFSNRIKQDVEFQAKLKAFQEQELASLASATSLDEASIDKNQKEIGGIYNELQNIQKQFDEINSQKKKLDNKILEAKQSIQVVLDQAKKTQISMSKTLEQVMGYTTKIKETKAEIDKTNKDKEIARATAGKFLDILYRIGNELQSSDQEVDDFKLLLKSENIATDLSNQELFQMLTMRFDQLIGYIDTKQNTLKDLLSKLEEQHLQYKTKLEEYRRQLDILNQQKEYLIEFIKIYSENKNNLINKESDLQKSRKQLLDELQDIIMKSKEYLKGNNFLRQKLASNEKYQDNERFFSRPVYPIENIQAGYNDLQYIGRYGESNQGVDIIVSQSTPVYAPADGYIYEIKSPSSNSLSYLIIIHNYGYTTLITTMNEISVTKGQYVERGQLLGTSGGEPGTKGAGFSSPGPRLHYEVYKDGVPVVLFGVTDLSAVKNPSTLPAQYDLKVLKDKLARKIDLSNVSYIQGASLEERIKNFINKYGNAPFDSYILRKQAASEHHISLELGVCIAVAETSFGRAFASARNIGNVGNNDRGDRIDFRSPLEGANVIYAALENEHLGHYPTLDKLSGYGNKAGPIYASSPINRQTNIVKCLTEIHGYRIPDDRPVRLYTANKK